MLTRHAAMVAPMFAAFALLAAGCSHHSDHAHIPTESAPPAVIDGFHREFPGLTISHVDRVERRGGVVEYELKFRDAADDYHRLRFSSDGQLLESKVHVVLPAPPPPPN